MDSKTKTVRKGAQVSTIKSDVLHNTLWGDFYLDSKTKTVRKGAQVGTILKVICGGLIVKILRVLYE